ncbi:methyl-accepting chemotaxis protein [Bacterioplanoides sp. SCSIO 12839]|uniref:methyl-accepting chemotaxis protein n=1 Tax=Bacterioplanoides sp. SCSIO 12839 TaxID=2829569 RepID=UPI0021041BAA|nr:methyl-accepting chemotaxis protein [Bacterioplanoides sp. SCSIO 12839]UTW49703.1 methyl-accepting chemotaxis protein [Bacterioplanoides sp. SCSIO 12839]
MKFLRNASVKHKLLLLLILPLLALLFSQSMVLKGHMHDVESMQHIADLAELSVVNSALAHEMQKERGMSAGYLGSGGTKFVDALPKQRQLTDQRLSEWHDWINNNDYSLYPSVHKEVMDVASGVKQLAGIRQRVSAQQIELSSVLKFYTNNIRHLLSVPAYATDYTEDGEISRELQAYFNFLQGKERSGIERAVLSNAFAKDQFAPGLYARFIDLVSGQNTYFSNYQLFANEEELQHFAAFKQTAEEKQVQEYRRIANDKAMSGGFGVDPSKWFAASTARINKLKALEDDFKKTMIEHAKAATSAAKARMWSSLVTALVVVGLTLVIAFWLSSLMYRQIRSLSHTMHQAGREFRLDSRSEIFMDDELGDSATALNEMLENISDLVRQMENTSKEVELISIQNHCTVSLSAKGMQAQQTETEKVVVGVGQLEQATREIAANIQTVANQSENANRITDEGTQVVERSVSRIANLNEHMAEVSSTIRELHNSSSTIGGVLNVIKSIAEQTNLLALNAAIEAARAGEQGRGFAVVADEVRTLAQRTQESTSEIESIIGKFQQESEAAFAAVEQSQSAVDESVSTAGELDRALVSIRDAISDIQNLSDQVASAAEEQVATNKELGDSMRQIHNIAEHTVETSDFMRKTSKQQRELSQKMNQQADRFIIADLK